MIALDKQHLKVLRYIYHHSYGPYENIKKHFKNLPVEAICINLHKLKLIHFTIAKTLLEEAENPNTILLGLKPACNAATRSEGNIIIEHYYTKLISFLLPISISTISLILSFVTLGLSHK